MNNCLALEREASSSLSTPWSPSTAKQKALNEMPLRLPCSLAVTQRQVKAAGPQSLSLFLRRWPHCWRSATVPLSWLLLIHLLP